MIRRLAKGIRRQRGDEGLTLLEVMISMVILAIGLIGLLVMQIMAMKSGRVGRHVTDAARIAQDQMELLNRQPWAATALTGWTPVPAAVVTGVADTNDAAALAVAQNYALDWRITAFPGDPNLRQLDVRVTWTEPGDPVGAPPRRYAVSSVRHDDPGAPWMLPRCRGTRKAMALGLRRRDAGFTLIEVMVSVAVLGLVTAYLTMMLVRQSENFEVVDEVTEAQQSLRAIANLMEREVRVTGFMVAEGGAVCAIDGDVNGSDILFVTDADAFNPTGVSSPDGGARIQLGYTGGGTDALTLGGNATATIDGVPFYDNTGDGVADSDFYFTVLGGRGGVIVTDRNNPERGSQCGQLASVTPNFPNSSIQVDWTVGGLVAVTNTLSPRTLGMGPEELVAIPAHMYTVQPGVGVQAPQMLRDLLPLADDVEDLQVAFLHDINDDGNEDGCGAFGCERTGDAANAYDASAADNSTLREVRFSFVVRTASQDIAVQKDPAMAFGQQVTLENNPAPAGADGFRRRVHTRTVRPRNVGIRAGST